MINNNIANDCLLNSIMNKINEDIKSGKVKLELIEGDDIEDEEDDEWEEDGDVAKCKALENFNSDLIN